MSATGRPTILLIGGTGRSGSTLLDRLLGELPGFVAVGELRYIWSEALGENRYCGCGARFLDCPFWSRVGSQAFGGWDRIDSSQVMAQERSIGRHRHIPLLAMGRAAPARYARRLDDYLGSLGPMYDAIRDVSGADVIVDRGVAWSWAKVVQSDPEHYMRRFSPPVTALRWVGYNLMVESLGRFGIPRLLLRYESLVENPQAALSLVASFAGKPLDPGSLAFLDGKSASLRTHHTVAGNPMRMTAGQIGLALDEAWRTNMPFAQRAQVTALTWPLLRHYAQSGRSRRENAENLPTALEGADGR